MKKLLFFGVIGAGILGGCARFRDHGPVVKEEKLPNATWRDAWGNEYATDVYIVTYKDGTKRKIPK